MNKYIKATENVSVPMLQMVTSKCFGLIHMGRSSKTNQAFKNVTCSMKIPEYIPTPVALLLLATQADVMEQNHTRKTSLEDSELSYLCFCKNASSFSSRDSWPGRGVCF